MPRPSLRILLGTLFLGVACQPSPDAASGTGDTVAATGHAADGHAATGQATGQADGGHAHAAPGEAGMALLPIMQGLGSNMTALTYALMTDDHQGVMEHSAAIAQHAPISAEDLQRIRDVLGADMARFEAVDESVHVASMRLHDVARAREPQQVVTRLAEVQSGCVSCHVQFRERLRTNPATPRSPQVP